MRVDLNNAVRTQANAERREAWCGLCRRTTSHIDLGLGRLRCASCGEAHVDVRAPGLPAGKRRIEQRVN